MEIKLDSIAIEQAITAYIRTMVNPQMGVSHITFTAGRGSKGPSAEVVLTHEVTEVIQATEQEEPQGASEAVEEHLEPGTPVDRSLFLKK